MNAIVLRTFDDQLLPIVYGPVRSALAETVIADSATLKIAGVASENSPTIDTVTGNVSYIWSANEVLSYSAMVPKFDLRLEWTITIGLDTIERVQFVDLLDIDFQTGINSADLEAECPDLLKFRSKFPGRITDSDGLTTIIDEDRLRIYEPNEFQGSIFSYETGSNAGTTRKIIMSDPATATLELDLPLKYEPDEGDSFVILRSWNRAIRSAWQQIYLRIQEFFGRELLAKAVDSSDFAISHLYKSIHHAIASVGTMGSDRSTMSHIRELAGNYATNYETTISQTLIKRETPNEPIKTSRFWGRYS